MGLNKEIRILGRSLQLVARTKGQLKGLSVGEVLSLNFYDGVYQEVPLLFVEPKKGNPTPRECEITAQRLSVWSGLPVVFLLTPGPTYERQRLMDKGVYFIMSDKYACLPMLVAVERTSNRKVKQVLTPVAQYLLLYHLQIGSLEGLSAREIAVLVPYSYESVTLGMTCLGDVALAQKERRDARNKVLHFKAKGADLWTAAQPYLVTPVEQSLYCDELQTERSFPTCGINALAHYSWLNPEQMRSVMIPAKEYRALRARALVNPNGYDGAVRVEVWKYPVVCRKEDAPEYVDKLSLALALREDTDPRVEGEVERMIHEIVWKD